MNLKFQMTVTELEEFYLRCARMKSDTEAERQAILIDMALEGYPIAVSTTNKTKEEIIADLQRNYKRVVVVKTLDNDTSESHNE